MSFLQYLVSCGHSCCCLGQLQLVGEAKSEQPLMGQAGWAAIVLGMPKRLGDSELRG